MAECLLHRVGTTDLRAPVHELQLQWTPATYSFVQRFRHSDLADGQAERAHHQHQRVAGPAHRVNTELAAIYWRERIHNLVQQQQQSQEEWRAYYRWAGFNPNQQQ